MIIRCPNCGGQVVVKGFGRRPLAIPFTKVREALERSSTTRAAAEILGCSVPYLYKVCKLKGKMPKDYIK
jgi:hypothetical protein